MTSANPLSLSRLTAAMSAIGARKLYYKLLAPNDNSKNQIYLGPGFGALNIFPTGEVQAELDAQTGRTRFKAPLNFGWLDLEGSVSPARHTQLILYPQYPEVRMSGFLLGSPRAPSALMTGRLSGRFLFVGVCDDGRTIGYVAAPGDVLAGEIATGAPGAIVGVFFELALVGKRAFDPRTVIVDALRRIHLKGWIDSKRLRQDGTIVSCESPNCGGYTLEAELGIAPNSSPAPDYAGWEVKQHGVKSFTKIDAGVLTLMTPEPTGGIYVKRGVEQFVRQFGYADRTGRADRRNVGGIYRAGRPVSRTGLTLILAGYDAASGKITDGTKGICLVSATNQIAAVWHYAKMMRHWNRKHALAAYVPSEKSSALPRRYRYGPQVRLGQQTDFLRFVRALASGQAYYDPGIKLEGVDSPKPRVKRRSQFRIRSRDLGMLYERFETVDLRP